MTRQAAIHYTVFITFAIITAFQFTYNLKIFIFCGFFYYFQAGSPRTARSPKSSASSDVFPKTPDTPLSPDSKQLSGVDGDIKEAFGDRTADTGAQRNLRHDLLLAADSVTNAMSSLVRELNSGTSCLLFCLSVHNINRYSSVNWSASCLSVRRLAYRSVSLPVVCLSICNVFMFLCNLFVY